MGLVIKNGRVVKKAKAKAVKATPAEAEDAKKRTLFQKQLDASIAYLDGADGKDRKYPVLPPAFEAKQRKIEPSQQFL